MALPLPVNILCGYLGAGKTTLLNRLLTLADERVLVMVNDFGDVAVDAALVSGRSADTIQLSNGCICCSMAGGVMAAFERALDLADRVDRLVIEASGVAEPARLAAFALAERDFACQAVVAVVDPLVLPARLADPRIGKVVEAQIRGADLIFLSRADIAGRASIRQAERLLRRLNPLADCHAAPDAGFLRALSLPHDHASLSGLAPGRDHRGLFANRTITLPPDSDPEWLRAVILRHARGVHRLKGFVGRPGSGDACLLQLAGGRLTLAPALSPDPGLLNRLVVISPDAQALAALAAEIAQAACTPPDLSAKG